MAANLKPCPFCGKDDVFEYYQINMEYVVHCENCGATGPNDRSRERAGELWNLRLVSLDFFAEHERMAQDLLVLIDSGTNDSVAAFTEKLAIIRNRRQQEGRR